MPWSVRGLHEDDFADSCSRNNGSNDKKFAVTEKVVERKCVGTDKQNGPTDPCQNGKKRTRYAESQPLKSGLAAVEPGSAITPCAVRCRHGAIGYVFVAASARERSRHQDGDDEDGLVRPATVALPLISSGLMGGF
jgi:hypothetical protein